MDEPSILSFSFRLLALMVMVLLGSVSADAKTTEVGGVKFGNMRTLIRTHRQVYHIEVDLANPHRFIFAEGHSLKVTDGITTSPLVGKSADSGYREGVFTSSRFRIVSGFTQLNATTIIVVDRNNHCLRAVERITYSTSAFVGMCTHKSFNDGWKARFAHPYSVIKGSVKTLLVADKSNHAIRQVDIASRVTITLIQESGGLRHPTSIALDFSGINLLISDDHLISKYNMKSGSLTRLTGTADDGSRDGFLSKAKLDEPHELLALTDDIILVADSDNNNLRVINLAQQSVSSICAKSDQRTDGAKSDQRTDGSAHQCSLEEPYSLAVNGSTILIGQDDAIRVLPFELDVPWSDSCPDDIRKIIKPGQMSTAVSWTSPSGDIVNTSLPAGDHDFSYRLRDESECSFIVSIRHDNPRLKKRLDFTAQYEVECNQIDSESFILKSMVNQRYTDIQTICSGECKRSVNYDTRIDCDSDIVTVSWPTDILLPSTTEEIPLRLMTAFKPHLKSKHLLSIVIPSGVPPIRSPKPNEDGLITKPVLSSVCINGFHYDQKNERCINPLL